jgi:hypothetical protein
VHLTGRPLVSTPTTSVDHVVPLVQAPPLGLVASNLRPCCAHHQRVRQLGQGRTNLSVLSPSAPLATFTRVTHQ